MDNFDILKKEYLKRKQAQHLAEKTIKRIDYSLTLFYGFSQDMKIQNFKDITVKHIKNYVLFLRKTKKHSTKHVYHNYRLLKKFFDFLIVKRIISENIVEYFPIKPPKKNIPRDILTEREVNKMLQAMSGATMLYQRDKTVFQLIYHTGLRSSEASNLNIYDIDFKESILYVNKGKGMKNRVVPLNDFIREELEEYINVVRPKFSILLEHYDALFVSAFGRRIARDDISTHIRKYARRIGLKKRISAHSIRHTFASHLLKNGASIRYIAEILGHELLSTTEIYTRVFPTDLKERVEKYHPRNNEIKETFDYPEIKYLKKINK